MEFSSPKMHQIQNFPIYSAPPDTLVGGKGLAALSIPTFYYAVLPMPWYVPKKNPRSAYISRNTDI